MLAFILHALLAVLNSRVLSRRGLTLLLLLSRYEFLIVGALCCCWGIVMMIFLPDSPITAKGLSHREKQIAVERLRADQTGIENKRYPSTKVLSQARMMLTRSLASNGIKCAKHFWTTSCISSSSLASCVTYQTAASAISEPSSSKALGKSEGHDNAATKTAPLTEEQLLHSGHHPYANSIRGTYSNRQKTPHSGRQDLTVQTHP